MVFRRSVSSLGIAVVLAAPASWAQVPSSSLVVVDVAPGAPEIDAPTLRADVARELGQEAVAPDDPRAPKAAGTLRVSVDRERHALVVSYRGATSSAPITRSVDLPGDRASVERAAVLLSGNLARDEADELAAELRDAHAAPGASPPPPSPPPAPSSTKTAHDAATDEQEAEDLRDLDRLGSALAFQQERARSRDGWSTGLFWGGLGALGASFGLEIYRASASQSWARDASLPLMYAGDALLGVSAFIKPGNFDELLGTYERERQFGTAWSAREETEQAWLRAANTERHNRRVYGWLIAGIGGLGTVLGGAWIAFASQHSSSWVDVGDAAFVTSFFAVATGAGVYLLASDGPVESALHAYERDAGHTVRARPQSASLSLRPFVAPTFGGGAMAGLGGSF